MSNQPINIGREQLRILSNPLRLAIHTCLRTDGPLTAKDLAQRINVDERTLYYHLRLMSRHGLLNTSIRPAATKPETLFEAPGPLEVTGLDLLEEEDRKELCRNVDSLFRAASKEYRTSTEVLGNAIFDQALIGRLAVRLGTGEVEELRIRLKELRQWIVASASDNGKRYSFTFAVTPIAGANGSIDDAQ